MLDVPADLSYAPVYRFEPMLITPPDHPLAHKADLRLEDLSPYGLILPPKRLTTYRLVDLVFQQNRVPYTVALEVGGWEVIKQYVAMGLGVSDRHRDLPDRGRSHAPGRALAGEVFPVAQLRRGGAQGQVPVAAGAGVRRADPAGPVRAARVRPERAFGALNAPCVSARRRAQSTPWCLPCHGRYQARMRAMSAAMSSLSSNSGPMPMILSG